MSPVKKNRRTETIAVDCRHFLGDRPCAFHKAEGAKCADCVHYRPVKTRTLIIKLGAMGDVLRTTSLLPALAGHFKDPHITWITRKESLDLLEKNPFLDTLLETNAEGLGRIQVEAFDLVINPETTKESAALASIARGRKKKGFGLSPRGSVFSYNTGADEIFRMGLWDDLKKRNQKTYEQLICQLSDLPYERIPPLLCLTKGEAGWAEEFLAGKRFKPKKPTVGINTGGGTRWPLKRWTTEGFVELGKKLSRRLGAQVLLFGGPAEVELNGHIANQLGRNLIDTGCFNPPRQFASLLNLCDVVVTGDSLALHIGLTLGKRMVVLLGPTSESEIDLYDLGRKITAEKDCLCCYRQVCDKSPNCMEGISVETVYQSVEEQLNHLVSK
jgi:ADP-heptose:LPS heptosyltransferase